MRKDVIFGSSRVMSPSNRALYITSIGLVIILNLGAILITLSLSRLTGYASSPHGPSVDDSCFTEMSHFAYPVHDTYLQSPISLCSCSKELEAWVNHSLAILTLHVNHSSVILTLHVSHSRYSYWFVHLMIESFHIIQLSWVPRVGWWGMP